LTYDEFPNEKINDLKPAKYQLPAPKLPQNSPTHDFLLISCWKSAEVKVGSRRANRKKEFASSPHSKRTRGIMVPAPQAATVAII